MKIIALSDIHGNTQVLDFISEKLSEVDLILISGDITHFGKEPEADFVINKLSQYNANILAVSGNCDYPDVGKYLDEKRMNLDAKVVSFLDMQIVGVGGSLPCPSTTPFERTEEKMEQILQNALADIDNSLPYFLVLHQPPINTITDQLSTGEHIGSHSLRRIIEKTKPLAVFCGHVHDGVGIDTIESSTIVNPGPISSGKYAYMELEGSEITTLDIRSIL